MLRHPFIGASSLLIGTAIGAGIFGIPFVVAQSGFWIGTMYMVFLAVITIFTLLAYTEVVLRTKGIHQFPGYAQIYLGKYGKLLAVASLLFGMYGALIAYITEIGNFLHILLHPYFGGSELIYATIFWLAVFAVTYVGLQFIVKLEMVIVLSMVIVLVLFLLIGIPSVAIANFTPTNFTYLFLPYGVILFAYGAVSAIPEIKRLLQNKKKLNLFSKSVIYGVTATAVFYWFFTMVIVGVTGSNTSESAIIAFGQALGPEILSIGALFGILTMGGSFLVIAVALKQIYICDFSIKKSTALLLTFIPPLLIYYLHLVSFIQILSIVGAITVGFQGVIIWLMYIKAKNAGVRNPEFNFTTPRPLVILFQLLFILGIIYEIWYISSPIIKSII